MLYRDKLKLISIKPIIHIYAVWHHFLLAIFLNFSTHQPIDGLFAKILESDLIPPSAPLHEHTHSTILSGAKINRQQKDKLPLDEQLPHLVRVSRTETLLISLFRRLENFLALYVTSSFARFLSQSLTRLAICSLPPETFNCGI